MSPPTLTQWPHFRLGPWPHQLLSFLLGPHSQEARIALWPFLGPCWHLTSQGPQGKYRPSHPINIVYRRDLMTLWTAYVLGARQGEETGM